MANTQDHLQMEVTFAKSEQTTSKLSTQLFPYEVFQSRDARNAIQDLHDKDPQNCKIGLELDTSRASRIQESCCALEMNLETPEKKNISHNRRKKTKS